MTDPDRVTRPHFCLQWGNVSQVGHSNLKRRGMEAMHRPAPSPPVWAHCQADGAALHGDNSELMERLGKAEVKTAPDCRGSEATGASAAGLPESPLYHPLRPTTTT